MCEFVMVCGLPGSGKTVFSNQYAKERDAVVLSSDVLRKELFGDENNNQNNDLLFSELHKRVKENLSKGQSVVYDATNINYKRRIAVLSELKKYDCKKVCYIIATPYQDCVALNRTRERVVPEAVIRKMYMNFYIPQKYEGWDEIRFHWNYKKEEYNNEALFTFFGYLSDMEQRNPNHTFTVGEHCQKCAHIVSHKDGSAHLVMAALLHDIGKYETMTFKDSKGIVSDVAHYYQHHHVGAYNSMFYLKEVGATDEEILLVCNYIQWHMQLYFIKLEKTRKKFVRLVGELFYNELMILHEADVLAH